MKSIPFALSALAAFLLNTAPAMAADQGAEAHEQHPATQPADAPAGQLPLVAAIVRKVDAAAGWVMLSHNAIPNLGMGAMTMVFPVQDRAWLADLKPAAKVRVAIDEVKGQPTVVRLERVDK